ncbi:hypothetical protein [Streptomyces sp. NBC_00328]|uniref:hypothetical protein n=1 Tax=Streptomyces sp. NBC_00328 TaxID=2903646 RepID=UPI002E2D9A77|nr:hypothetical protein [Streptomyces sp. NBC_00328]
MGGDPRPAVWAALFNGIDALPSRAPSSPELRAALYEVLAGIPGIRLRGPAKDAAGRTGTAVELDGDDRRGRLVIAPGARLTATGGPGRDGCRPSSDFLRRAAGRRDDMRPYRSPLNLNLNLNLYEPPHGPDPGRSPLNLELARSSFGPWFTQGPSGRR